LVSNCFIKHLNNLGFGERDETDEKIIGKIQKSNANRLKSKIIDDRIIDNSRTEGLTG
jgi:hypothetical protein